MDLSQTLDISYLSPALYELLRRVDYQNARFTRKRIYFSCNYPGTCRHFTDRKDMLKGFGMDAVCVVCIYGFDTTLARLPALEDGTKTHAVPFFQEYWPFRGFPHGCPPDSLTWISTRSSA